MPNLWTALGRRATGDRLARMQASPQYGDGRFTNRIPFYRPALGPIAKEWLFGTRTYRSPSAPVPVVHPDPGRYARPPEDLRITWLGHASLLIEIEGLRLLTDPVWGDFASPGRFVGIKRFFPPPLPLDLLPPIDAVVLSHDHYDHLNEPTIRALIGLVPRFIAPLGVGAHLESWGVPSDRITELDWWERLDSGNLSLVCTPARHFSGRTFMSRDTTLWCGWAFLGRHQRAYFSGDSGLFSGFADVGARLGPFDVTMMEIGAYNAAWADIHMGPEQAVQAHRMLRGALLMSVHWATFQLALHGWTEPVERLLVAAEQAGVRVAVPRPGESIAPADPPPLDRWWPDLPWRTAQEAPIVSSGLDPDPRPPQFNTTNARTDASSPASMRQK